MPGPLQGTFRGRWIKTSGNLIQTTLTLVSGWAINEAANGIAESSGTFTVSKGGLWLIVANVWGPSATNEVTAVIGPSSTDEWARGKNPTTTHNGFSITALKSIAPSGTFGLYVAISGTAAVPGDVAGGFNIAATMLGA